MKKQSKKRRTTLSRRAVLQRGAKLGALPFAILIPSGARAFVFDDKTLRPFREREEQFEEELKQKLAQFTRPPPGTLHPPPARSLPPRITYTTNYATSKNTDRTKATFSNNKSDDTDYETVFDGTKEDYKTDVR